MIVFRFDCIDNSVIIVCCHFFKLCMFVKLFLSMIYIRIFLNETCHINNIVV